MRSLIILSMVLGVTTAFAQSGSAGSAAPAAGSAGSAAPTEPAPPPAPPPAPAVDVSARKKVCEDALAKPPGGDTRFISDVQSYALGQVAAPQLAKTPEGQACADAVGALEDFRSTVTTVAREKAANELATEVQQEHQKAAEAIQKNQKHVVMAYAALWILAVGFLLFLWRRQQALKTEITQLKRDLEAATK